MNPREQVGGLPIESPESLIARLEQAIENAREWQETLGACETTKHSAAVEEELLAAQVRINGYRELIMDIQLERDVSMPALDPKSLW